MNDTGQTVPSPLYECWCKGTDSEDREPRYSQNWAFARRAQFKVFSDRVSCGDWEIKFEDVTEAIVYGTRQWFIPVQILQLVTNDRSYQFGFNPWAKPVDHLALEYTEQKVRLKYSLFSVVIRVGLLSWLTFEIWQYLK